MPPTPALNISAHLCTLHAHTHRLGHCYSRGGLAIEITRVFPGGPINNGPMDDYLIFYLFFLPRLALVTMVTLPARGERHASAQPTVPDVMSLRLIMTDRHQGDWTNYHFLLLYQPLSVARSYFIHKNRGLWQFWTAVFLFFICSFLHGPLMASGPRCSCTSCTADT